MKNPHDETKAPDSVDRILHEAFQEELSEESNERMTCVLTDFREDLENHPYVRKLEAQRGREPMGSWFQFPSLIRALGYAGAGAVLVLILAPLFLAKGTPTWAQVVERFRSVQSYTATIYARGDAFAETEQFELWANAKGEARMRTGSQVIFAKDGSLTKTFDLDKREAAEPESKARSMLSVLDSSGAFSLDTLMRRIGGDWVDSTPKLNADAIVSEDLVVFDVQDSRSESWARVWALRESKLPVQLRSWEPHDGECVDVFFSYSKDQPREFYDPDQFASKLEDQTLDKNRLAYAFLEDPADKQVKPGAPNEAVIYSTVTRTLDGEPWSLGDHRGKAALIGFWKSSTGYDNLDWWKEIYRKYGDREDFVMAGVALDEDANSVREYCQKHGIEWLQLHEPGMGYKNRLAQAFGGHVERRMWLVWKHGKIDKLGHAGDQVQAALEGLSYETESTLSVILAHRIQDENGLNREQARELCGEPDEIAQEDGKENWSYRLPNKEGTAVRDVTLTFDSEGRNINLISSNRILNPALIKVFIGEKYWDENIAPKIDPTYLPKQSDVYGVALSGRSATRGFSIGIGHPWNGVEAGLEYLRQAYPETYDLFIVVSDKRTFQSQQEIPLATEVELIAGETRQLRFE